RFDAIQGDCYSRIAGSWPRASLPATADRKPGAEFARRSGGRAARRMVYALDWVDPVSVRHHTEREPELRLACVRLHWGDCGGERNHGGACSGLAGFANESECGAARERAGQRTWGCHPADA